jgi:hypothetical protein
MHIPHMFKTNVSKINNLGSSGLIPFSRRAFGSALFVACVCFLIGLLHFIPGVKTLRATPTNLRVSQVAAAYLKLGSATPIMTVATATRPMKRTAQTKSAASKSLLAQVKCAFL